MLREYVGYCACTRNICLLSILLLDLLYIQCFNNKKIFGTNPRPCAPINWRPFRVSVSFIVPTSDWPAATRPWRAELIRTLCWLVDWLVDGAQYVHFIAVACAYVEVVVKHNGKFSIGLRLSCSNAVNLNQTLTENCSMRLYRGTICHVD